MPIQQLVAMKGGAKIHADDLLGFLVMYTLPDRMVGYKNIVREWANEGLDPDVMPGPGRPTDIFGLACAAVATKRTRGLQEIILAERASTDGTTYQITRSVRDNDNRIVEHPKAMTLHFDPHTQTLTVTKREDYEVLENLENLVRANYRNFRGSIPGSKVRTAVRGTIVNELGGTSYMGKGIYMVPRDGLRVLESIEKVLDTTYGGDAHMSLIPLLDTKRNRDDLSRFHADDIRERCETLMQQVGAKLKAGGGVRADLLANVKKSYREIRDQRDQIIELVGRETETVENELELLAEQIEAFMDMAGAPEEVAA